MSQAISGGRWVAWLGMKRGLKVLMSSNWAWILGWLLGVRATRALKLAEVQISRSWAYAVKWANFARVSCIQRHSRVSSEDSSS